MSDNQLEGHIELLSSQRATRTELPGSDTDARTPEPHATARSTPREGRPTRAQIETAPRLLREYAIAQRRMATLLTLTRAQALADATLEAALAVQQVQIQLLGRQIAHPPEVPAGKIAAALAGVALGFVLTPVGAAVTESLTTYVAGVFGITEAEAGSVASWLYDHAAEEIPKAVGAVGNWADEQVKEAVTSKSRRPTSPLSQALSDLVAAANTRRRGMALLLQGADITFEMYVRMGGADAEAQAIVQAASHGTALPGSTPELDAWEAEQRALQEATLWAVLYGFVQDRSHVDPQGDWVVKTGDKPPNGYSDALSEKPGTDLERYWALQLGPVIEAMGKNPANAQQWNRLAAALQKPSKGLTGFPTSTTDLAAVRRRNLLDMFFGPLGQAADALLRRR